MTNTLILRDYQEEAIDAVMQSWQAHQALLQDYLSVRQFDENAEEFTAGRELVVMGTGAGKTVVFSQIIKQVLASCGGLALILAHRDDLLDQAIDKYVWAAPGTIVGKVKGAVCELGGEVTVASVASACKPRRIKAMKAFNYSIIVIDEAHHMAAQSYQTILKAFPHAFVLMVTATPDRLDGKRIIEKEPIYSKDLLALVKAGYLCTPRAHAIQTDVNLDELHTSMGDFKTEELSVAVNTPARNHLIATKYLEYANGMPFIGFGVTVDHAHALAYAFSEMGIPCGVITGTTSTDDRKAMYAAVADGSLRGMFSVQVLTEGFDLPCIACVIMARPTMSRSLYVQMIGRASRLHPNKDHFLILDITDNCMKHRLTPHNLNKALNLHLADGETLEEMEVREEQEAEEEREKQKMIRKLAEKRKEDFIVNLLQQFNWQKRESDGAYLMSFGKENQHKAALQCNIGPFGEETYTVWQALAPAYTREKLTSVLPLDEALAYAEKHILKLLAVEDAIPRRGEPPTEKQSMLAWRLGIAYNPDMITRGELSDLISAKFEEIETKKAQKRKKKVEA